MSEKFHGPGIEANAATAPKAPRRKPEQTYLSDGVHASFDGWYIVLEAHNESGSPARIYLDPTGMTELVAYADRVFKRVDPKERKR